MGLRCCAISRMPVGELTDGGITPLPPMLLPRISSRLSALAGAEPATGAAAAADDEEEEERGSGLPFILSPRFKLRAALAGLG